MRLKKITKLILNTKKNKIKGTKINGELTILICCVCEKTIKTGQYYEILIADSKSPEDRYYHGKHCGPGTENWYKFHPSELALSLLNRKKGN